MNPADLRLLAALQQHNAALRAVLCTLARRGAGLRRDDPVRAATWLDTLAVHPYYKGGQFLFDLLEWEDFMLDGDAPPLLDEAALAAALGRLADMLRAAGQAIGQPAEPWIQAAAEPTATPSAGPADLPPLNGSLYLFPDVVLGLVTVAAR